MPVPKRKTSKARRDQRSSTKFIRPQAIASCQNCEAPLATHVACSTCGFYKGKKVLRTKLERVLKRGEQRAALKAKSHHEEEGHEGHGHEGHEHGEGK